MVLWPCIRIVFEVGKIELDDGDSCDFKVGDRSVFFPPMM